MSRNQGPTANRRDAAAILGVLVDDSAKADGRALTYNQSTDRIEYSTGVTPASYTHNQVSPSTSWVVNHNLGYNPQVEVFSAGGAQIITEVTHVSVNQTIINFTVATAGFARFV